MGSWDTYCAFCGMSFYAVGLPRFPDEDLEQGEDFDVNERMKIISKWLDKVTLILQADIKAKHGFKWDDTDHFINPITGEDVWVMTANLGGSDYTPGVAMHTDCWKFAKKISKRDLYIFPIFNLV